MRSQLRDACSGFTLLEALAAVITLGLLAAAVVPLLRQLGRTDLAERVEAQGYLRSLAGRTGQASGTAQAIDGHPGWSLVIGELIAEAEQPLSAGSPPPAAPAHRWRLLSIRAERSGETLAESLVAVLASGAHP